MKNKQTILYTLLGIMFGVVIGMMTINSASAVDLTSYNTTSSCHEESEECKCGESCEEGKDCECKECGHTEKVSCKETKPCSF